MKITPKNFYLILHIKKLLIIKLRSLSNQWGPETHFFINSFNVKEKMKKDSKKDFLNRDEVNEMIESAIRRHNRRSTIISSVLGWILIGGYSFGLFQAVQNV